MEHLLIRLILWFDGSFQKSLQRVIPNLEQLLADPRGTLSGEEVRIGAWRRYGAGCGLGLIFGLGGQALLVNLEMNHANMFGPPGNPLRVALHILLIPAGLLLGMFLVRGGHAVLSLDGVLFHYRGKEVLCPWSLFNAPGVPVIHPVEGHNRFEMPVAPAAVPLVELRRHGYVVAHGLQVKSRHFKFRSVSEAILKNIYRAREEEVAWLLQHLGRTLGQNLSAGAKAADAGTAESVTIPPAAVREEDGWVTVRLTQVRFPPCCCDCGADTDSMEAFRAYASFLRFGGLFRIDGGEFVWVYIPLCPSCRRAGKKRYWRTFFRTLFWGTAIGSGSAGGLSLVAALVDGDPRLLPGMPIFFGTVGGILGFLIAWLVGIARGRKAAQVVELARYSSAKGTCALRFGNRDYAEEMLLKMDVIPSVP